MLRWFTTANGWKGNKYRITVKLILWFCTHWWFLPKTVIWIHIWNSDTNQNIYFKIFFTSPGNTPSSNIPEMHWSTFGGQISLSLSAVESLESLEGQYIYRFFEDDVFPGVVKSVHKEYFEIDSLVCATVPNMNSNGSLWTKPSMSTKSRYKLHRNSVLPSSYSRKSL